MKRTNLILLALSVSACDGLDVAIEEAQLGTGPGEVEVVAEFDPAAGELPENMTIDRDNRIVVSHLNLGALDRVARDGSSERLATFPGFITTGVTSGPGGDLYVIALDGSGDPSANAVWRVDRHSGEATTYAAIPEIALPNDLAFDWRGDLYISDSIAGAVWKVDRDQAVSLWVASPLLGGPVPPLDFPGHPPFPIGANGIALTAQTMFVANTDRNTIIAIPRNHDGSAGNPEVHAGDIAPGDLAACFANPELVCAPDGLAIDIRGNIYVAGVGPSTVIRVSQDGSSELLASAADGLDSPSDCAFGRGRNRRYLYCSNYAVISAATPGATPRPSVTRQYIGIPGRPRL